jgi:peptidyl-prolyl cis-trans isomerase C
MSLLKQLSLASAVVLSLSAPSVAQESPNRDTVVATVNEIEIKLGHIISIVQTLPSQYAQVPTKDLYEGILDQLVQQTLLVTNLPKDKVNEDRIQIAMENERRALISAAALDLMAGDAISDDSVQKLYESQVLGAEANPEFQASHILVETEEEANAVLEMAQSGSDFAELAKEKSTGPSGPSGGDLGWFGRGAMVPEFDQAVAEMKVGEVVGPIKTDFGWHVIRLNDQRDYLALEDVRADLEKQLRTETIASEVERLQTAAKIEIVEPEFDLDEIRNFDLFN